MARDRRRGAATLPNAHSRSAASDRLQLLLPAQRLRLPGRPPLPHSAAPAGPSSPPARENWTHRAPPGTRWGRPGTGELDDTSA